MGSFGASAAIISRQNASASTLQNCKNIPGDAGWPAESDWDALNKTVEGRLIATVPIAHVCHDPTYLNQTCNTVREAWGLPDLQVPQPAEILAPIFQNGTCDPYSPESAPCRLGNYVSYSINVSNAADAIAGLQFSQKHNVRLVVKNTGHDFFGKSAGKGGLALWTHNLNSMEILPHYESECYTGAALKMGAGSMGGNVSTFTSDHGYRTAVGDCPTVGLAGGWAQGGGVAMLSGLYGLGADNILEWEVVTANGEHLIATPSQNQDLYWAMSGGGGGSYAVALSMTMRVFEDGPIGRASFAISNTTAGSTDAFWEAVNTFHSNLQPILDNQGISVTYIVLANSLIVLPITAPNRTAAEMTEILAPLTNALGTQGLNFSTIGFTVATAPSFLSHYNETVGPELYAATSNSITSGRMLSRDNLANNVTAIGNAMRSITANGHFRLLCTAFNANGLVSKVSANAHGKTLCRIALSREYGIGAFPLKRCCNELTNIATPALEAATPGSAIYLNEANYQQPDWQEQFYGDNYPKLRAIKEVHDPGNMFYGLTAVGSEAWEADSEGRLCRTGR
ncbi:FAD-linked oxidoreductase [Lachnellula willkommii]|uniref:FAD-linked oxidoreductase n=1 Tax=Lachnellula willkommii TaxID=215461 RepID=A0A559M257_9HELO|nr:FAD-linked oxidoreductase [Lachnellula willkommii]